MMIPMSTSLPKTFHVPKSSQTMISASELILIKEDPLFTKHLTDAKARSLDKILDTVVKMIATLKLKILVSLKASTLMSLQ